MIKCPKVRMNNIELDCKKHNHMYLEDSCLFSSLGWIEADQSVSVAGLTEDLSKFPAMNSSFSFAEMKKCSKDLAKSWSSRAKRRRWVLFEVCLSSLK